MSARGFTLVEVMAACAVLVVGICGTLEAGASALDVSRSAREMSAAAADLAAAAESVNATAFDQLAATFPDGAPIAAFSGRHLAGEQVVLSYVGYPSDPLEVRIAISWRDGSGATRSAGPVVLMRTR